MVEDRASNTGASGQRDWRIVLMCLFMALSTSADVIVDLGSARDFMFLDINPDPVVDAVISKAVISGDIGWSGGADTEVALLRATLGGDLYRAADSALRLKKAEIIGTDYPAADMSRFIADVNAAVARFGLLTQDIDLGAVDQQGGLTIGRTDKYTVIDMSEFKITSGTLTLDGEADDIFYIRIRDAFELNNVDVVVNGTDASRVFFIYEGSDDLEFNRGGFSGNIIAPNATVLMSGIRRFEGSVISGDGFSVAGSNKRVEFEHVPTIPEATALSMVAIASATAIFIRRFFKLSTIESRPAKISSAEAADIPDG
jgi:hypothetical protein